MSYKNLEIWTLSKELVIEIKTTFQLPKFEQFEEAQLIRRSMKSVKSNPVEGYGRRRYKQEFIRFLIFSISSLYETPDHLETLFDTGSLNDKFIFEDLSKKIIMLRKKFIRFLKVVELHHNDKQISSKSTK
ncbi:MAG: four helix bundle protein [Ferruginibacter sp.]